MDINGVTYHLRRARPQLIQGGYTVSVTCGYTDKTATKAPETGSASFKPDPAIVARLQNGLLAYFQNTANVHIRNFRSNDTGTELWSMQRTVTGASSTAPCVLTLVTTRPTQSNNVNNPAKTYQLDFGKVVYVKDPYERAVAFRAEHMADGEWGILILSDPSNAKTIGTAMKNMVSGCQLS
jgi:hypothetical protein